MSRVGKLPIQIPSGVTITVDERVTVTGPKGTLSQPMLVGINISQEDGVMTLSRDSETKDLKSKHGLMRALINNMVVGVTEGFSKKLEINGVGYRVAQNGNGLKMSLGFSHEVNYALPQGVASVVDQNTITISGIDKQQVGQVAAEIRSLKKPEPYKGKGIKYSDERIIRKAGKSGKDK